MYQRSKAEVRKFIQETLNALPDDMRIKKSVKASNNLLKLLDGLVQKKSPTIQEKLCIGAYDPMKDEVDWLRDFPSEKFQVAYPHYEKPLSSMCFKECQKEVVPGVLVIPGRAFTKKGERLGRGKGYYDYYLETYRGVKVGLCFKEQLLPSIPVDHHDIAMDFIVSDAGIIQIKNTELMRASS